jgi:hypothetical protein
MDGNLNTEAFEYDQWENANVRLRLAFLQGFFAVSTSVSSLFNVFIIANEPGFSPAGGCRFFRRK